MRAEHLKLLLLDISAIELLTEAAAQLAGACPCRHPPRARNGTPHSIARARWRCAGHSNWRRVSPPRVQNARQTTGHHVRPRHTPIPIRLATRAGTDALAAHVRAALATRRDAVLVSLDGRGAYDTMSRAAFSAKLREVVPELLPFVRMFYGRPSTYSIRGGIPRAGGGTYCRGTGANRGMPPHRHCSPLDNMKRCARRQQGCTPRIALLPSWTTFTSSPALQAHGQPWTRSREQSRPTAE